jgi:hypothetical protein
VLQGLKELLVPRANQESRELLGRLDRPAQLALRESKDLRDSVAQLVLQDRQGPRAPRVLLETLVTPAPRDRLAKRVLRALRA